MKKVGIVLVAVGVIIAGVHLFYAYVMSGEEVGVYKLVADGKPAEGLAEAKGEGDSISGKAGPVKLDTEMNPVRALMHVSYSYSTVMRPSVSVSVDGETKDGKSFCHYSSTAKSSSGSRGRTASGRRRRRTGLKLGSSSTTLILGTSDVAEAGDYVFDCRFRAFKCNIKSASLELRRNVSKMSWTIVGLAIVVAGVGGVLIFLDH